MDLGSSIRRRRKRPRRVSPRARKTGGAAKTGRTKVPRPGGLRVRTAGIALIIAGAGLAAGYMVSTIGFFPPEEPPPALQGVPELWGQPMESAMALLADSGLAVGGVDSVRHPIAPAGVVIGQSPLPGRTALPSAPVRVTVSQGPEMGSVPDVTRLRGGRAAVLLESGGFVVQVDTVESDAPAGRVIAIDPVPGSELALPGSVRLEVSLGPPTFPMPDLSGVTQWEVWGVLDSLGLILSGVERRYSILNVDRVFGQYPGPYFPVELGTAVRVIVGEEMRPMRDGVR